MNDLTLVIPAYNEAENLRKLIPELLVFDPYYKIIIVNDGSKVNTDNIVAGFKNGKPTLSNQE